MKAENNCRIRNALLVLARSDGALRKGDVTIRDGKITHIWVTGDRPPADDAPVRKEIDASGLILMPGLVNGHYHSYGSALKGTCNDKPLECWAPYTVAWGHALSAEGVRLAVLLGAAEMIRGGITTCIDHFPNLALADEALTMHQKAGMRVGFAPMMQDIQDWQFFGVDLPEELRKKVDQPQITPEAFEEFFVDLYDRWHGRDGRISIMLGPNAPQRCSQPMWNLWQRLDARLGMHVHTHLLETRAQANRCEQVYPGGVVAALDSSGLLNNRLSVAHGIWTTAAERQALNRRGVTVVSAPATGCVLGDGIMPIIDCLGSRTHLGLGTDSSNAGGPLNMLEAMRLALSLPRLGTTDFSTWPAPLDVWTMATWGSARALGQETTIGEIAVGKQADLVLLDARHPNIVGVEQTLQTLVCHAGPEIVRSVMVDGEWILRDGRILSFDEGAVVDAFLDLVPETVARAQKGLQTADELLPYLAHLNAD